MCNSCKPKGGSMKATMYLYGIPAIDLAAMNYKDALEYKIKCATKVMSRVGHEASKVIHKPEEYLPLLYRYESADKAKQFNQELLAELDS